MARRRSMKLILTIIRTVDRSKHRRPSSAISSPTVTVSQHVSLGDFRPRGMKRRSLYRFGGSVRNDASESASYHAVTYHGQCRLAAPLTLMAA